MLRSWNTKIWDTWYDMVRRCHDPEYPRYDDYGGRGVFVCARWREDWKNFRDDMGYPPEGKSIDRIDNNGPYSPENCRWATRSEQQRNRRDNVLLTFGGKTLTRIGWAEETGIGYETIKARMKRGLPAHLILHKGRIGKDAYHG